MNKPLAPLVADGVHMVWRFNNAALDEARMELTVAGQGVALERKPLEVLRHLLRHAGEVVTKDELHEAVWPGRMLSESVLMKAISRIRDELGPDAGSAIKTVHGYGYRLVAEVSVVAARAPLAKQLALSPGQAPPQRPNWALDRHLDNGGRAEVWLSRHRKTSELRVLKLCTSAEGLTGLKREITLHRLFEVQLGPASPMVPVLDFNLEETPFFIELPYLPLGNLKHWAASQGGLAQLPLAERLALFSRIASHVAKAHAVGVLHKDLKPSNILITTDPQGVKPLLADFGSAGVLAEQVLLDAGITGMGFTQRHDAERTPLYAAPEVLMGQPHTTQSDLYALGVMLYQLLRGDLDQPLAAGWEQDISCPVLQRDIAYAVQGDPARRMRSVAELAERISRLDQRRQQATAEAQASQQQQQALARAQVTQRENERYKTRRRWMQLVAGVFLLGALIASALAIRATRAQQQARLAQEHAEVAMRFLVEDVLGAVSLRQGPAKQLTVNQLIERAAHKVESRFTPGDWASRARTYAALYQVYGVTDYPSQNDAVDEWLHQQHIHCVHQWFKQDPAAAYSTAYDALRQADFWDSSAQLQQLLLAVQGYALNHPSVPPSQRLSLQTLSVQALIQQGHWAQAAQQAAQQQAAIAAGLNSLLAQQPLTLILHINNASKLGLHASAQALCHQLLAGLNAPPFKDDASLQLDLTEACAVAASSRADWPAAARLSHAGLSLAQQNYDEQVGYLPTFNRYLSAALASQGQLPQALALAQAALAQRRARKDDLVPYVLSFLGSLKERNGESGLAEYQEATQLLAARRYDPLALEPYARLALQLARNGQLNAAQQALAHIPGNAVQELPPMHRYLATLWQAQGELALRSGSSQGGQGALALFSQADAVLAANGYPPEYWQRQELRQRLAKSP